MIRTFQFRPTGDNSQQNWDKLTQDTATKLFTPVLTDFIGDDIEIQRGYYVLYGPIVFITVHLKSEGSFGWDADATVEVPVEPYSPTNDVYPQAINPVVDITTSLAVNSEHPQVTSGVNKTGVITLVTAQAADKSEVLITGFYLRN